MSQIEPIEDKLQLAVRQHRSGNLTEAIELYKTVLAIQPESVAALSNLGVALARLGAAEQAIDYFRQAIRLEPRDHATHLSLARALLKMGRFGEAADSIRQAIQLEPDDAPSFSLLSKLHRDAGRPQDAIVSARRAIQIDSRLATAHLNLGAALYDQGAIEQAVHSYVQVLRLSEGDVAALNNLRVAVHRATASDEGREATRTRLRRNPDGILVYRDAAERLRDHGDSALSAELYDNALKTQPDQAELLWDSVHALPILYRNEDEISHWRNRFENTLTRLEQHVKLDSDAEITKHYQAARFSSNFLLAYQNQDDRTFQERYGRLIGRVARARFPAWTDKPAGRKHKKLRVGYASFNLYGHTITKLFCGWIKRAPRQRFEVCSYYLGAATDDASRLIASVSDHYRHLPKRDLSEIGTAIVADQLDVLVYPDLGMDPYTALLASLNLAPVQCVAWGHPVTTGIPTVDYFLTSELMEPSDASAHYSEQLVRLPNLSVYYHKPKEREATSRNSFGIPEGRTLYLSCQFVPKYLPEYDEIFPRIATEIPNAYFVFIAHKHLGITRLFQQRLEDAFKKYGMTAGQFCRFFTRMEPHQYMTLNRIADVYLDTIGWSGGNTSLEALAQYLPVVTLPGQFMRGRHTYAMLTRMELAETIAENVDDFVSIAVRLGQQPDLRQSIRTTIRERHECLFHDEVPVQALHDFYEEAVQKAVT